MMFRDAGTSSEVYRALSRYGREPRLTEYLRFRNITEAD